MVLDHIPESKYVILGNNQAHDPFSLDVVRAVQAERVKDYTIMYPTHPSNHRNVSLTERFRCVLIMVLEHVPESKYVILGNIRAGV